VARKLVTALIEQQIGQELGVSWALIEARHFPWMCAVKRVTDNGRSIRSARYCSSDVGLLSSQAMWCCTR
jgi:hypothetical protein